MTDTIINISSYLARLGQAEATAPAKHAGPQLTTPSTVSQEGSPALAIKADQTSLSTAGGLITQALSGSDVRTEKVASLQKAIASGTYNVSSAKVADKLLQSLLGE